MTLPAAPALVIFDCDGVLIDSETLSALAEARLFRRLGLDIDAAFIRANYIGLSWTTQLSMIRETFAWVPPADLVDQVRAEMNQVFAESLRPIDGVAALLDALVPPRCVASSSDPARLEFTLGLTGLYPRLAPHIFSATMVENGKPAPDLFLHAAREMGAAPAGCIVIEDSVPGVTAACAAGMAAIGFTGGSHSTADLGHRLAAAGAAHIAASMTDVAALIGVTPVSVPATD